VIEAEKLTKFYGKKRALNSVDLTIPRGVYGLLGPNGAGKSTLIRIFTGTLKSTSGTARVAGYDCDREIDEVRQRIAIIPQEFSLYPNLNPIEFLEYMLILSGKDIDRKKIMEQLDQVNLLSHAKRRIGTFSGGMKQRVAIAQALIHDPLAIFADEPTAGLDPEERVRFRNLFSEIGLKKTVLLSTHITEDITAAASQLSVLHHGRIIFSGAAAELIKKAEGRVWSTTLSNEDWELFKAQNLIHSFITDPATGQVTACHTPLTGPPERASISLEPNLEHAYTLLIEQQKHGESDEEFS
jgi:ABC-2 type transport system ATP-binding protein